MIKTENKIIDIIYPPEKKLTDKRNYGIDFLRILSMFYVVVLHSLRQCGITDATEEGSAEYAVCWFMQICTYGAVNIFALISGYVGYSEREKELKYSSWFRLWLEAVFYGAVIGLILNTVDTHWVTGEDYVKVFFPVTNNMYWYFTAYTGLFMLTPLINAGIRGCSKKTLRIMFVSMFAVFSVIEIVSKGQKFNVGYSFGWLFVLYVMGAIIRKCEIGKNMRLPVIFACIFVLNVLCFLWKIYGFDFYIFSYKITQNTFISYLSPVMVSVAVLHLVAFSKIRLGKISRKITAFASPCAFAVYLINTQYHLWNNVMEDALTYFAEYKWYTIALLVFVFSFSFMAFSVCTDRIRMVLFRYTGVDRLAELADKTVRKATEKFIKDN